MHSTRTCFQSSLFLLLMMAFSAPAWAQKTITIHPVKKDTTDTEKTRIRDYYTDTLFKFIPGTQPVNDPKAPEAELLYEKGLILAKGGKYKDAIEVFSRSLALLENSNTYMRRGFAYLLLDNNPLAIQDFNDAIRLIPGNRRAVLGRGIARYQLNDLEGANGDLQAYLKFDTTNAIAYNYMAAVCFLRNDYSGALANYDAVVRLDTTYPDIFANRGMMRHYLRDFNGAIADYERALRIKPGKPTTYNNRAAAYMMLNEFGKAEADLTKAIEIDPMYADAYDNRGRVRQRLGDLPNACQDWQKAWSLGLQSSRDLILKYCK